MEKGKLGAWIGSIIIGIFVILFALPTLLSTSPGTKLLGKITGSTIEKMSLSWFGGQQVDDFARRGKQVDITFKRFSTDSSLLVLILTKRAADTQLLAPDVTYRLDKKGKTPKALFLPFKGGVDIQDGTLKLVRGKKVASVFQDISVRIEIEPLTITAHGFSAANGTQGEFQINGRIARDVNASEAAQLMTKKLGLPNKTPLQYSLDARITNFPLAGFDDLKEYLGPTLNLNGAIVFSSKENSAKIDASSKTLRSHLDITAPKDAWVIAPGSSIDWSAPKGLMDLLQSTPVSVRSEGINIPINDYENASGAVNVNASNAIVPNVTINSLNARLSTQQLKKDLTVDVDSQINTSGSLQARFTWPKPLQGWPSIYDILIGLQLQARQVPTKLIRAPYLGPTLDLRVQPERDILDIDISSKLLQSQVLSLKINPGSISLSKRAIINYTFMDPRLKSPSNLHITLSELIIPRTWQKLRFKGSVNTPKVALRELPYIGELTLRDVGVAVQAKNMEDVRFSAAANANQTSGLLDPNLDLNLSGRLNDFTLVAKGPTTDLQIDGLIKGSKLVVDRPIDLKTMLKPKTFKRFVPQLQLAKKAPIELSIAPFSLNLENFEPVTPLHIELNAPNLLVKGSKTYPVNNLKLKIREGGITASGKIEEGNFDVMYNPKGQGEISLRKIPTQLLDDALGDNDFIDLFGPIVSMDVDYTPKLYTVDINSPRLDVNGALKVKGDVLENKGSLKVSYLYEGAPVKLAISELSLPLKPAKKPWPRIQWDLSKISLVGEMRIDEMKLKKEGSKVVTTLKNFSAELSRPKATSPLSFEARGNLIGQKSPKSNARTGKIDLKGEVADYYNAQGKFSLDTISANIDGELINVPTLLTDLIIPDSSTICGDNLSAKIQADIVKQNGTVDAVIKSPHCAASVAGFVRKGVLSLREPLRAEVIMTPNLSRMLLEDANLIVVSAKGPISLYIDPQGVSIPLYPMKWSQVRIGAGRLDFGQLIVASKGSAADIVEILKLRSPNQVSLWFAPLDFTIRQGVMSIGRTEILYDMTYQVAVWGRISFPKRYVDMTLGLTAQALNRAFGINVPGNFVMTVDFEGPFGNVKIDKAEAIAKIALLLGNQSGLIPKKGVAGGVFGIIQGFAHDQSDVPPPKHPFPWQ